MGGNHRESQEFCTCLTPATIYTNPHPSLLNVAYFSDSRNSCSPSVSQDRAPTRVTITPARNRVPKPRWPTRNSPKDTPHKAQNAAHHTRLNKTPTAMPKPTKLTATNDGCFMKNWNMLRAYQPTTYEANGTIRPQYPARAASPNAAAAGR